MEMLDSQELPIECANCGQKTPKTIAWIKVNDQLTCTCGTLIEIERDQLLAALGRVDQSMRKLKDTMRRIGKTTIKLKL